MVVDNFNSAIKIKTRVVECKPIFHLEEKYTYLLYPKEVGGFPPGEIVFEIVYLV